MFKMSPAVYTRRKQTATMRGDEFRSNLTHPKYGGQDLAALRDQCYLAFLTMTNIRHFWVASNFHYPMQTIKTMWKAIFQNKLTIYKANLPSFAQKIIKSRCYSDTHTSAEMLPKNGGVRKANWVRRFLYVRHSHMLELSNLLLLEQSSSIHFKILR